MNFAPWIFGALGILGTLVGVIYNSMNSRLLRVEKYFTSGKDGWSGKSETIVASATRLDDLERRMNRLEDTLQRWMERVEEKIDAIKEKRTA